MSGKQNIYTVNPNSAKFTGKDPRVLFEGKPVDWGQYFGYPKSLPKPVNGRFPDLAQLPKPKPAAKPPAKAPAKPAFDLNGVWSNDPELDGMSTKDVDKFLAGVPEWKEMPGKPTATPKQPLAGGKPPRKTTLPSRPDIYKQLVGERDSPYGAVQEMLNSPERTPNPVQHTDEYAGSKTADAVVGISGAVSKLLAGLSGHKGIQEGVDAVADYGQGSILRKFNDQIAQGKVGAAPVGLTTENQKIIQELVRDAQDRRDRYNEARMAEEFSAALADAKGQDQYDLTTKGLNQDLAIHANNAELTLRGQDMDANAKADNTAAFDRRTDAMLLGAMSGKGAPDPMDAKEIETTLGMWRSEAMRLFPDNEDLQTAYYEEKTAPFFKVLSGMSRGYGGSPDNTMVQQLLK